MDTTRRRALACLITALACSLLAASAHAGTVHFESPSGNIDCFAFSTPSSGADCLVRTATWARPPRKPASCDLDWAAHDLGLSGQKVFAGSCRGDVGPLCYAGSGHCTVLAYGTSVTVGTVRCSSATAGVTCRSTVSPHHGFRIARQGFMLYR
jgi:hypothetical protein